MPSESEKPNKESRPWADLPGDILHIIVSLLPYRYYPHIASVCKTWRACVSPVYPADKCPLLAHFQKWGDSMFRYYSPLSNKTFIVDQPFDLTGNIAFYYARDGWLLLYKAYEFIFANPITGAVHKSPYIDVSSVDANGVAFSGKPPHDCTVFATNTFGDRAEIIVWKCGEDSYSCTHRDSNMKFVKTEFSNPVPLDGVFYCLGMDGNVGIYDPNEDTWTIVAGPKKFDLGRQESYLVESNGELLSVIIGKYGTPIKIFKLNRVGMTWELIENIGSASTLFIGSRMSLSTKHAVKCMRNRVYFPRFHGDPEIVHAEIKCSESRILFVPKARTFQNSDRETRTDEAKIFSYRLDDGRQSSEQVSSKELLYSIWFEARI